MLLFQIKRCVEVDDGFINDNSDDLLKHALDQSVAKSEGSSSKGVEDVGVDLAVILGVVAIGDRQDVQLSHVVCTKHNWQPFIVGNMLKIASY